MISYIFKNKTKNILAIVFTALCMISPLGLLMNSLIYFPTISVYLLLIFVAYLLILIYLLTLKHEYKLKNLLFPLSFAIKLIYAAYLTIDILDILVQDTRHLPLIVSVISNAIFVAGGVLCCIGSAFNFKRVTVLRVGIIIYIIVIAVITPIVELVFAGGFEYFKILPQEQITYFIVSVIKASIDDLIQLMFYISLLLLTLNKKSEDIDITPYVEARKAKKAAKRAARLEAKLQEEAKFNAPVPEIPDGSWRCMACGKILPDSIDRCECGYKK